jgi:VWFA-related protein
MRRVNVASLLVVTVAAFLSLARPAVAGQPKPTPQLKRRPPANQQDDQSFVTLRVTTNLVVLDVVATDQKGKPVTDLKAGDFTLLEDEKEQKISVFHLLQPASAPTGANALPQLAPNVFSNLLQVQPAGPRTVIVLDAWRTAPTNQMFARAQIMKLVKEMPAHEPVAILELGNEGIRMLQDFTTDPALLVEAAKKIQPQLSLAQFDPAGGPAGYVHANHAASVEAEALERLATALASYPGRKNLIWISDSMTVNPYSYGAEATTRMLERSLVPSAFDLVENENDGQTRQTASAMMDSQTAIYPMDPSGIESVPFLFTAASSSSPFSDSSEASGGFGRGFTSFGSCLALEWPLSRSSLYRHAVHDEMEDLAARTGGKAFYGSNSLAKAIAKGITDGSTYYELGYYPCQPLLGRHFPVHRRQGQPPRHQAAPPSRILGHCRGKLRPEARGHAS